MWKDLPEHGGCPELKQGCSPIQDPTKLQGTESLSWLSKPSGNYIRVKTPLLCVGMIHIGRTGVHWYPAAPVVKTLGEFHAPW